MTDNELQELHASLQQAQIDSQSVKQALLGINGSGGLIKAVQDHLVESKTFRAEYYNRERVREEEYSLFKRKVYLCLTALILTTGGSIGVAQFFGW